MSRGVALSQKTGKPMLADEGGVAAAAVDDVAAHAAELQRLGRELAHQRAHAVVALDHDDVPLRRARQQLGPAQQRLVRARRSHRAGRAP